MTTSNLTADNIKSGVTVTVGDSANASRVASVTGTYSGGGGSAYTPISVGALEVTTNYTSTSASTISSDLHVNPSLLSQGDLLYIVIRDKAGKRNDYFYGQDQFFIYGNNDNDEPSNRSYWYSSNKVSSYTTGGTSGYGVYLSGIDNTGALTVRARYNSTYSKTIDGTYSIDIYKLEWLNNVSPLD